MAKTRKIVRRPARRRRRKKSRRARPGARLARHFADAGFYVFAGAIVFAAVIVHFARDLPDTNGLWRANAAPRLTLAAADGSPIAIHGQSHGLPVRLSDLPPHTPRAVLAVEDRNFYHHIGINPLSVARALLVNLKEGEVRQGGSTLTQQLAKNLFLSSDQTIKRKIQEFFLALWLEQRFTKDEILTLYLNRVYFGAGAYGVDAASYRYFGKPARNLTLPESAVLAGLLKAPSHYAPDRNPADAGQRARLVVDAMLDAGFITREQADFAYKAPVRIGASRFAGAPYFVDFALAEARKVSAGADGDLLIKTTFDAKMQDALETGVVAGAAISRLDERIEIAAVILDAEGGVKAMVGGRDYRLSQFNRASNARRQPGSAFKPFVYLAALELGASPDDIVADKPISIGKWSPSNYNDKYYGDVTLREGLSRSLNGATIRLQEQVGRGAVRIVAKRMGYPGALNQGPALALGVDAVTPLDLAAAYAPLVNGGYRVRPHAVSQISFSDGEEVYRRRTIFYDAAATETNLAALNEMLASVVKWGTGGQARLSRFEAHGKTGTTQDNRDAWFAGHAGGLVCVVWVGRDDYKPMGDVTGGGAPAIIWREIMERALASRAPRAESPPILAPLGSAATALAPIGE
ncbi:MAG: PBP1A family penicillin-binding protein [Parvularculaceae bacterium]|nr:PBP1A family penicillin-binding protein [Parvularculaceae bacterium]